MHSNGSPDPSAVVHVVEDDESSRTASVRLLEKTGFKREGYARGYLCINGIWQDHLLYARLKDDAD